MTKATASSNLSELDDAIDALIRLRSALSAISLPVPGIANTEPADDNLSPTMRAVFQVLSDKWPMGRPAARRKMLWYGDIQAQCALLQIVASERLIRETVKRQKLAE